MPLPRPVLVSVDWGTTSLRCALLAEDGEIIEQCSSGRGIMTVQNADFAGVLTAGIGPWRAKFGPLPILMSGMIGSRQGWVETPYLPCPATPADLARALAPIDTQTLGRIHLVPGLAIDQSGQNPDVMRGEETQIVGAMRSGQTGSGIFVLPGSHSKWATTQHGAITSFATYMTGEVFAALHHHTILGRLMPNGETPLDPDAFNRGVTEGAAGGAPGTLLHRLFSTRTLGLFDRLPAAALESYLSGLLIGAEIAAATQTKATQADAPITIVGSDILRDRYQRAANTLRIATVVAPPDCAARGHLALARIAKLIQ